MKGSGSGRPKTLLILRIRIRYTVSKPTFKKEYFCELERVANLSFFWILAAKLSIEIQRFFTIFPRWSLCFSPPPSLRVFLIVHKNHVFLPNPNLFRIFSKRILYSCTKLHARLAGHILLYQETKLLSNISYNIVHRIDWVACKAFKGIIGK